MTLAARLRANAPNWPLLALHALVPANLPRVLAGIGFTRQCGPFPRGGSGLYQRRDLSRPSRHFWRSHCADLNNVYMDRPCRLLVREAEPRLVIEIDTVTGEWCDTTGGLRGESIIDLAALALGCRYGQAGYRIARLCGLWEVPVGNAQ